MQMLNLTYVGDFMAAHLDTLPGLIGPVCFCPRLFLWFQVPRFSSTIYFVTVQGGFVAVDLPDFSLSVSDGQVPSQPLVPMFPQLLSSTRQLESWFVEYYASIAGWGRPAPKLKKLCLCVR